MRSNKNSVTALTEINWMESLSPKAPFWLHRLLELEPEPLLLMPLLPPGRGAMFPQVWGIVISGSLSRGDRRRLTTYDRRQEGGGVINGVQVFNASSVITSYSALSLVLEPCRSKKAESCEWVSGERISWWLVGWACTPALNARPANEIEAELYSASA